MEDVLRSSGLDWTAVRPARLSNASVRNSYRVIADRGSVPGSSHSIARADLARFMVGEIGSGKYVQRGVAISD